MKSCETLCFLIVYSANKIKLHSNFTAYILDVFISPAYHTVPAQKDIKMSGPYLPFVNIFYGSDSLVI